MMSASPTAGRIRHMDSGAGSPQLLRIGAALLAAGAALAAVAFLSDFPIATAAGISLTGTGIVVLEFGRNGVRGLNPLTSAGVMFGLGGLADIVALLFENSDSRDSFFLYASAEHIGTGLFVMYAGLLSLWAGYQWASQRAVGAWKPPSVWADVRDAPLVPACVIIYAIRLPLESFISIGWLGTLASLILLAGPMAAFLLTRRGAETGNRTVVWVGVGVAVVDAVRAALFEILRMNMLLPLTAGVLGLLIGTRSFRAFRRVEVLPIYLLLAVGLPFFGTFAKQRGNLSYGSERFSEIQTMSTGEEDALVSIVSRFTTLNQVSQVVRLVDDSGYRQGETLEYLAWVWIPRFVWPDKPMVAKGQWFAAEIGQGFYLASGMFSNTINMTIPGELYLNFGWLGIVVGCLLIGALFRLVWQSADFWKGGANPWGNALGFFLLYCGAVVVIDLQLIVSLIASYLVLLAVATWTRSTQGRNRRVQAVGPGITRRP